MDRKCIWQNLNSNSVKRNLKVISLTLLSPLQQLAFKQLQMNFLLVYGHLKDHQRGKMNCRITTINDKKIPQNKRKGSKQSGQEKKKKINRLLHWRRWLGYLVFTNSLFTCLSVQNDNWMTIGLDACVNKILIPSEVSTQGWPVINISWRHEI